MPHEFKASIDGAHFSPDILDFIRLLGVHKVRYVVVGGEAVIYHGYPRFTGDIDFFFANDEENVGALFAALREFWGGDVPGLQSASELAEAGLIIQFGRPPNRIDLMNRIDAVTFEDAWKDRVELCIATSGGAIPLFLLDRQNLIRNKRASARPKDLDDLTFLEGEPEGGHAD
jgi:hypothetical protein